ncbi:complex I 24 kDa subunit family protein [Desulfotomaculum sp. 1211_IL3151]|uniref:complex I 24 kDa subunit family protein n=1 Tax=Desulfotomaculum sp. 1211_IL3151 TaxID=3084055 RepID=UPI002FD9E166
MDNQDIKLLKVQKIIDSHEGKSSHLIGILQETQAVYGYLPKEVLTYIATSMGISPATILGVATFYAQFSLIPKGKYVIRVCDGTACHVRGSEPINMAIRKELSLAADKPTTDDLMFTLEIVSCLGACGLAPVVVVDDEVHGQMTPDGILEAIKKLAPAASEN